MSMKKRLAFGLLVGVIISLGTILAEGFLFAQEDGASQGTLSAETGSNPNCSTPGPGPCDESEPPEPEPYTEIDPACAPIYDVLGDGSQYYCGNTATVSFVLSGIDPGTTHYYDKSGVEWQTVEHTPTTDTSSITYTVDDWGETIEEGTGTSWSGTSEGPTTYVVSFSGEAGTCSEGCDLSVDASATVEFIEMTLKNITIPLIIDGTYDLENMLVAKASSESTISWEVETLRGQDSTVSGATLTFGTGWGQYYVTATCGNASATGILNVCQVTEIFCIEDDPGCGYPVVPIGISDIYFIFMEPVDDFANVIIDPGEGILDDFNQELGFCWITFDAASESIDDIKTITASYTAEGPAASCDVLVAEVLKVSAQYMDAEATGGHGDSQTLVVPVATDVAFKAESNLPGEEEDEFYWPLLYPEWTGLDDNHDYAYAFKDQFSQPGKYPVKCLCGTSSEGIDVLAMDANITAPSLMALNTLQSVTFTVDPISELASADTGEGKVVITVPDGLVLTYTNLDANPDDPDNEEEPEATLLPENIWTIAEFNEKFQGKLECQATGVKKGTHKITLECEVHGPIENNVVNIKKDASITVFRIDIQMQNLKEEEDSANLNEFNPGAIIVVDDDKDDLQEVNISFDPEVSVKGILSLAVVPATLLGGNAKLWADAKATKELDKLTWKVGEEAFPKKLYLQGTHASTFQGNSLPRDVELRLNWIGESAPGNLEDIVYVSVVDLNMFATVPGTSRTIHDENEANPGLIISQNNDFDGGLTAPDCEDSEINGDADKEDMSMLRVARLPKQLPDGCKVFFKVNDAGANVTRLFDAESLAEFMAPTTTSLPDANAQEFFKGLRDGAKSFFLERTGMGTMTLSLELVLPSGIVAGDDDLGLSEFDMDVDSDNDNGFAPPSRSAEEDAAENKAPGKILQVNDGDTDGDGIPDFADGYDIDFGSGSQAGAGKSATFVPVMLEIPYGVDPATAKVRFAYSDSAPADVKRTGKGTSTSPYKYAPAKGSLRLWTKNGTESRLKASVVDSGDFIPAGEGILFSKLSSGRTATVYVEAVEASASPGDLAIKALLAPDGEAYTANDSVVVTANKLKLQYSFDKTTFTDFPDYNADGAKELVLDYYSVIQSRKDDVNGVAIVKKKMYLKVKSEAGLNANVSKWNNATIENPADKTLAYIELDKNGQWDAAALLEGGSSLGATTYVVKIEFTKATANKYGFDAPHKNHASDYNTYISIKNDGDTVVNLNMTPLPPNIDFCAQPQMTSALTIDGSSEKKIAATNSVLQLKGTVTAAKETTPIIVVLRAVSSTNNITFQEKLHVWLYKQQSWRITQYRFGTTASLDSSALSNIFKQVVLTTNLLTGRSSVDWDKNKNGALDYYNGGTNPETDAIKSALKIGISPNEIKAALVDTLRDNWRITQVVSPTQVEVEGIDALSIRRYVLRTPDGTEEANLRVIAINKKTGIVTLTSSLPTAAVPGWTLSSDSLAGLSLGSDGVVLVKTSSPVIPNKVAGHEISHQPKVAGVKDNNSEKLGAGDLMQWNGATSSVTNLKYRLVDIVKTGSATPDGNKTEHQWNKYTRDTP